jgi:peptide/nickel transport system ATP-binding protein
MAEPLLDVKDLQVRFATEDGIVQAVAGLSFNLEPGKVLGIVGESGSGKSVTAMTVMGLTRGVNARFDGEVLYKGTDLLQVSDSDMQEYRGNEIGMIFQDPMTSLNPVYRIGSQIAEAIKAHENIDKRGARARAVELLRQVGIPNPESRVDDYPHQFSGGMRQRAMIAMALSCNPSILIADEPTTALDVTIQAQIVDLIGRLKDDFKSAVIFITHDLGVIAEIADEIIVMYAGRVVEQGSTRDVFYDPQMPYTWGLLGSIPRLDRPKVERLHTIEGAPPSLINLPQGCKFRPRCPHARRSRSSRTGSRRATTSTAAGSTWSSSATTATRRSTPAPRRPLDGRRGNGRVGQGSASPGQARQEVLPDSQGRAAARGGARPCGRRRDLLRGAG